MKLAALQSAAFACTLFFAASTVNAAPGDQWNSGQQFHSPRPGAPQQEPGNPASDNAWEYGYRVARGYNDGQWEHMDASPFVPFPTSDEYGPAGSGTANTGPDLNRWWVPFPPPAGKMHVGRIVHAEGPIETGPDRYLKGQVHLLTDDDAPTTGIVSLRWTAPHDGVFAIRIDLQNRLDVDEAAQRDPFYHIVINDVVLDEAVLQKFGTKARHEYAGLSLKSGDAVEVCASTGSIAFPFAMLAADVTITEADASTAQAEPRALAERRRETRQGAEPVLEIGADHPYVDAMKLAASWVKDNLGPGAVGLPLSFVYDGKPMFRGSYGGYRLPADSLRGWKQKRSWQKLDDGRLRKTITYRELKTDLELRLEVTEYSDFPVVEWVAYFKNQGKNDTPILEHIQALNTTMEADGWTMHHSAGSWPGAASYAPFTTPLDPGRFFQLSAYGGRPSNTDMPYFNFERGDDGVILAIGWPGQWRMMLQRDQAKTLHLQAGQERTHLRLRPGEEIRTPLIAILFRAGGDWIDGQNVWRRWMMKHNLPRPGGEPVAPILSGSTGYFMDWMYKGTEANQIEYIDRFLQLGIDIDHWWMDTGWFTPRWEPAPDRFPRGIKPISEHAHSKGIKTILWFEPERVTPDNPIGKEHPEWVLHSTDTDQGLFNLGDPAALKWMTDHIHKVLQENEIDVFRSDFNMDPVEHWRQNDAPDRQGITENLYVTGYLSFWDELRARIPTLLIDSCASGGRRNDLETMRRSVPLWKCDYAIEPVGMQCQVYGLSMWLPYFGNAGGQIDKYVFRSNMYPAINKGAWEDRTPTRDIRDDSLDYELLQKLIGDWRRVSPNYSGDFYPLSNYSLSETEWMAWQFHATDGQEGFVQVFRRKDAPVSARRFQLRGLDAKAIYQIEDLDNGALRSVSGEELMQQGIEVSTNIKPSAIILVYRRQN